MTRLHRLVRLDAAAGGTAAVLLLALASQLAPFANLSATAIRVNGMVNLVYATLGLVVLRGLSRHPARARILATANLLWTAACVVLFALLRAEASALALAYIAGEGLVCLALGVAELRAVARHDTQQA